MQSVTYAHGRVMWTHGSGVASLSTEGAIAVGTLLLAACRERRDGATTVTVQCGSGAVSVPIGEAPDVAADLIRRGRMCA